MKLVLLLIQKIELFSDDLTDC